MCTDKEVSPFLQTNFDKYIRSLYLCSVMGEDLKHWTTGLDYPFGWKPLAQQILPGDCAICQVYVTNMVHYLSIDLFRHSLIETAISRFHVKHRDLSPLCRQSRKTTVRVTKNE